MEQSPLNGSDRVRRFIFESLPVRGHWVHLTGAWRELRAHARYPQPVDELLGEAVAAAVLLAASLKFSGTLAFQLEGNGAVRLLVAQCTHDFRLRAVARFDEAALRGLLVDADRGTIFRRLAGTDGRITVTIEAEERGARYQGVVPIAGSSLAESLEAYFATSEQLPTRVLLAAEAGRAAGMLVQKLPGAGTDEEESGEAWRAAQRGMAQLPGAELLGCPIEELLGRGFAEHDLRLFKGAPVRFECRCSHARVEGLLRALGEAEIRSVLEEEGAVTVTCEFCHRPYSFDGTAIQAIFGGQAPADGSSAIH